MISKDKKDVLKKVKIATEPESFDLQFKKMIKEIIVEEGYFKERDIKDLMDSILKEIEPLISKHIKNHFYEIGNFIMNNSEPIVNKKIGDKKDA
jgi:nucleoid DNA-binding protein